MLRSQSWTRFAPVIALAFPGSSLGQTTTRVSVDSSGGQAIGQSSYPACSADGRFIAFASDAANLVSGDTNSAWDIFVRDRQMGVTERVSVSTSGVEADVGVIGTSSISNDGRYVVFDSHSTSLVSGDTSSLGDVFLRDRQLGTTIRVSVDPAGQEGDGTSFNPVISGDGRFVVFASTSGNLLPPATPGASNIFVYGVQTGTLERITSIFASNGHGCNAPQISADGRLLAFDSEDLDGIPFGASQVYCFDRVTAALSQVSMIGTTQGNGHSIFGSLSANGRYVAFWSESTNLVVGDTNGVGDILVRDLQTGAIERISVDTNEAEANGPAEYGSPLSADGRLVAFWSNASNLVSDDTNGTRDVFLRDRQTGQTSRVSLDESGSQVSAGGGGPVISGTGRFVVFSSGATDLVPGDTNGVGDVFLRDREFDPSITPFCFGDGSGVPCPCNNTGQLGRGCDNSIVTGGGALAGTGEPRLSADTFLLTASGERATSVSVFWQGGTEIAPRPFGDGIGCMGSPLKRLYARNAVGGTVSAPQGSDLSISARSAAVGDPITPGTSRVYHTFYRDGAGAFCPEPAGSSFNVTGGLRVRWGP